MEILILIYKHSIHNIKKSKLFFFTIKFDIYF
jgi:hypothetical protein